MKVIGNVLLLLCPLTLALEGAPTAIVEGGVVVGTATALPHASAPVNKFLGVPFAQSPPVRFTLPKPVNFFGTKKTVQHTPACVQQFVYPAASRTFYMGLFNNPPPPESEDCLYLDVYVPSTPPPPGGRTVMVWIYGGSLQFGTSSTLTYDGASFAGHQDVIFVGINYRTNIFGFPGSPEIPVTERNVGFYDQRFALQWVQRNIHAFGGNPQKVTIFGESSGSTSVDRLVTTHPVDPPFRAAILHSGTYSVTAGGAVDNTVPWAKLTGALGCNATNSPLACVRSKPATMIKDIIEKQSLAFNPVQDNITSLEYPEAARLARKIATVPVLEGSNSQEGRLFVVGLEDVAAWVGTTLPGLPAAYQAAIIAAYPVGGPEFPTGYDAIAQIFTELIYQCPASIVTNDSATGGIPTWRYYFNASFPNTQGFPNGGVYHSSEIPIVFGTYPSANATVQEIALSQYVQGVWAGFAKDPIAGPGWNRVHAGGNNRYLGVLGNAGNNRGNGVTVIDPTVLDARCALYKPLYAAATTGNSW